MILVKADKLFAFCCFNLFLLFDQKIVFTCICAFAHTRRFNKPDYHKKLSGYSFSYIYFNSCALKPELRFRARMMFGMIITSYCVFFICWCVLGKTRVYRNTSDRPGTIIMECARLSPQWIICALIYLGLLSVVCLILSLRAQKLTTKTNECKFINFSLSGFLLVWLTFIPAYNSTDGRFAIATEMFAIIASAYIFLGCMYIPKCYMLLRKKSNMMI